MKAREQEPEGFEEFWNIWRPHMRHTDGRGDARKAYRKHILDGAEPADIIDGAKAFLRSLSERDKPYIPLAASWINKEAYADWAEQERAFQKRKAEKQTNVVHMPAPVSKSKWLQKYEAERKQAAE
jgi:hypothetical protein